MKSGTKRKAKIVCTLGPSSSHEEMIQALIDSGLDVARLNFSHGEHSFHENLIHTIRSCAKKSKKSVAIMQDLQGPKLRVGKLGPAGIHLERSNYVHLYPEDSEAGTNWPIAKYAIPISSEIAYSISKDVKKGSKILFDDGKISSTVQEVSKSEILIRIDNDGLLTNHKGMNLPGTPLSLSCLTEKDLKDLEFGLKMKVDAIALSFVRQKSDLIDLQNKIKTFSDHRPLLVAKIEREEGIENIEEILEVVDVLLIARGDMAVEIGAENVPSVQKKLIRLCNQAGVPVITATQMLESMISSPTPTRAEASDVANAVFDGTDAVMLSGETASGKYPLVAVETMSRIILQAEQDRPEYSTHEIPHPEVRSIVDAIELSASEIAKNIDAKAIACITNSGKAAQTLAKFRPETPILAIVDQELVLRRLAFHWGVQGIRIPKIMSTDDIFKVVEECLMEHKWVSLKDLIVVTAGIPTLKRGSTNMIKVHRVGDPAVSRKISPSTESWEAL